MKCKNCELNYWFGDYALNYCKIDKEIITDESECRFMCLGMANGGKKIFKVEEVEAVLEYFKQCQMDTFLDEKTKSITESEMLRFQELGRIFKITVEILECFKSNNSCKLVARQETRDETIIRLKAQRDKYLDVNNYLSKIADELQEENEKLKVSRNEYVSLITPEIEAGAVKKFKEMLESQNFTTITPEGISSERAIPNSELEFKFVQFCMERGITDV